jgi:transketolase
MADKVATRQAFGEALAYLGGKYKQIVALDADLTGSVKTDIFKKQFSDREFNVGVAEADMIGTAAGMALRGKMPFACSFAVFSTGRCWEQIRNSVCYPNLNVKIVGSHAGILTGEDGATHQALEDIAIMRVLPNMKVFCPADYRETISMMEKVVDDYGPAYIRLGRQAVLKIYDDNYQFEIGKASILKEGTDIAIIACGSLVSSCLTAAQELEKEGISCRVINMCSIKPIDEEAVIKAAKETKMIVTAEDHNIIGGLGSAVCEVLCTAGVSKKVFRIGMQDRFGESGKSEDLYKKFGFDSEGIVKKIKEFQIEK